MLVLRSDRVGPQHFRAHTVLPVLGVLSCVLLLTQQEAGVWLRALVLLAIGAALYAVTRRAVPAEQRARAGR